MSHKPRGSAKRPQISNHSHTKSLKRKREIEDVESLNNRVTELEPKPTSPPEEFSDLPLSQSTQDGLEFSHFKNLTAVQASAIPLALKGKDILGAAKTGSGKTLAFLIPVLENLFRRRWTEYDGVGAVILSPTRELAIQIFDVLRKVGRNHTFSAGLVIGGKSMQEERERLGRMNILVATPGRMLQHLDQAVDLDIGNLQMLVLDEADRIMDMGFKDTVDAIVDHLPKERQTLMFSATQTKKISDLARLSLTEPEFVSVHESADTATPASLQQNYIVTPLSEKLDVLWSFLRANVKKKILVFLSTGKQVRFVYEAFRHLQPGVPLLHLRGRQKQSARLEITTKFSNSKHACLFSTDVAARGLDFPAVDWVVQVDCPEDADTYIHRVGRTARYERDGRAVLFVDPSEEEGMLATLAQKRVSLEKINVREKKMQNSVRVQLQNMCFKDPELKYVGQKAFMTYVRSIHLQKNKDIFKLKELNLDEYAASMGLPGAPKVKFVKGEDAKSMKNMPRASKALHDSSSGSEDDEASKTKTKPGVRTKYDRMFDRRNQDVLADHYTKLIDDEDEQPTKKGEDSMVDADEDNDFLSVKRRFAAGDEDLDQDESEASDVSADAIKEQELRDMGVSASGLDPASKKRVYLSTNPDQTPLIIDSKRREKLLKSRKALLKYKGSGTMRVFNSDDEEDNEGREKVYYEKETDFAKKGDAKQQRQKFLEEEKDRTGRADEIDKEVARQKKREKKERRKEREKMETTRDEDGDEDMGVQLLPYNEDYEYPLSDGEKEAPQETKRKKWFEQDTSGDASGTRLKKVDSRQGKKRSQPKDEREEPQTLEDLEAMASGLLAR